jgi:phosphoribosylaminoimidazole-succinocarboxamide synthase
MHPSPVYSGKVRELYAVGQDKILMVASDRISAFDVILPEPIPNKGRVLTAMTAYWLEVLADLAPSHLISADPADMPDAPDLDPRDTGGRGSGDGLAEAGDSTDELDTGGWDIAGRAMLVRRADMLPLECIVRGYVAGSAWKEYERSSTVHGTELPKGMLQAQRLDEPMFTPSTKAEEGHDENISFAQAVDLVGSDVAGQARDLCLEAYKRAAAAAESQGILVADTKFELGWIDGELCFCDEVLTPDSSRFWPARDYQPGTNPPSFDKQPVRDWLEASGWDKQPPPPNLPADVVRETSDRYITAYERICGRQLSDWFGA